MPATPNPKEEIARDVSSLQSQINSLGQGIRLTKIRDEVEDLQTTVNQLSQDVSSLRSRGYVFGKDFEARAVNFSRQWTKIGPGIMTQIEQQSNRLQTAFTPLGSRMPALSTAASGNMAQARTLLNQLKPQASALESQVKAAEAQLNGMYNSFKGELYEFSGQVDKVDWMLTQLAESSFQLLATEAGIMAVKAVWAKDGKEKKDDPEGVLYLTDQRLIFEQKEEVATKKILFITTEKQKVQNFLFDTPVALVEAVNSTKQGLFKNEDHIDIKFATGEPFQKSHFHIWHDCEEWQSLITRAKIKDFEKERAVAVDAAAEAKIKSAPNKCPSCGGNIQQVILRGQDNIKCEFCGTVIRL